MSEAFVACDVKLRASVFGPWSLSLSVLWRHPLFRWTVEGRREYGQARMNKHWFVMLYPLIRASEITVVFTTVYGRYGEPIKCLCNSFTMFGISNSMVFVLWCHTKVFCQNFVNITRKGYLHEKKRKTVNSFYTLWISQKHKKHFRCFINRTVWRKDYSKFRSCLTTKVLNLWRYRSNLNFVALYLPNYCNSVSWCNRLYGNWPHQTWESYQWSWYRQLSFKSLSHRIVVAY